MRLRETREAAADAYVAGSDGLKTQPTVSRWSSWPRAASRS
jgi:hypothetical protein